MKLKSTVCGSLVVLVAFALTLDCATGDPSVNYNSSKSNTGNLTVDNPCPAGQIVTTNAATGRKTCAMPAKSINYNAGKSNTGSFTDKANGGNANSHGGRLTSSPRYHCGKGEYTLQNGDCVPNPPSKPND
jgi:hypothetical protein